MQKLHRARPDDEYFFREGCHVLELSNSDEDPAVSIARIRVEPGVTTRRHRLCGISERYVILQGQGVAQIDEQSAIEVQAGDVLLIGADCAQMISNTGADDLVFLAICSPRFTPDCYAEV